MSEFVVRPFAFMRLTHEAFRAGFLELQGAAHKGDVDAAACVWTEMAPTIKLHMRQEEEVFFPLLDQRFDNAVGDAGLRDTHTGEATYEAAVDAAIEAKDADALRAAVDAWADDFEHHLAAEEQVMMPLTERVAPTLVGRAEAVRTILDVDWDGVRDVQLPWVVQMLAKSKPYGPIRMFVAAVQAAAGSRYADLEPAIRASLAPDVAQRLVEHGHLTATGSTSTGTGA